MSRKSQPEVAELISEQIEANYRVTVAALEKAADIGSMNEEEKASEMVTTNQFISFFEESFVTVKDHFDDESECHQILKDEGKISESRISLPA